MFCNRLYCEKANRRLGGVGKELFLLDTATSVIPSDLIVGGRLKTGQWWSIQNQPLNWLVTGLALCWQDAFWRWDGNSAGKFCG